MSSISSKPSGSASAWSRPLKNNHPPGSGGGGGRGGGGGGGAARPPPGIPPGMERGRGPGGWGKGPPGGANGGKKAHASSSTANKSENNADYVLRERFLHLVLSMVGQSVLLTTTAGQAIEGIFHTFSPFDSLTEEMRNVYVLKACRVIHEGKEGGQPIEEGSTVVIPSNKVASVQVKSLRLDAVNEKAAVSAEEGFATDAQISGGRGGRQDLVAASSVWTSAGDGSAAPSKAGALGGTLEGGASGKKGADAPSWRRAASKPTATKSAPTSGNVGGKLTGGIGDWDQFSANEKKFNVKASFDENLYTTALDHSNIDEGKRAEAERIAREIQTTVSTNIHVAEERGQKVLTDYDEEDLYSGVLTKDLKAREVPKDDGEGKKEGTAMNFAAAAKKGTAEPAAKDEKTEEEAEVPDISKGTASSEEKKVEADPANDDKKEAAKEADKEKEGKKDDGATKPPVEVKSKLNATAKVFKMSAAAKEWTPPAPAPPAAPPQVPQPGMDGGMGTMGGMGGPPGGEYGAPHMMGPGGPGFAPMPGMMPVMNPQMRQGYPPYGGPHPGQPGMPPPPPPPQPGGGPPGGGGPEDNASVGTGESSGEQPPSQHQPQSGAYMGQPGYGAMPPGAYPYGYPGAAMMGPGGRGGGPGFHPQMGPPGGPQMMPPYGGRGMYGAPLGHPGGAAAAAGMMHRGPHPGYPYGGGGGPGGYPGPYPGPGGYPPGGGQDEMDNSYRRNNSGGPGRGGGRHNNQHGHRGNKHKQGKYGGGRGGRGGYQSQNSQDTGSRHSGGGEEKAQDSAPADGKK